MYLHSRREKFTLFTYFSSRRKVGKRNFSYRRRYAELLISALTEFIEKAKDASVIGSDMQIF